MGVVFTNNAETTLAAAITSTSATSISVTSSSTFPTVGAGEYFYATIDDGSNNEIVKITAVSGTTWTVVRAQDNTTARTFANGSTVQLRTTAALLTDIQENIASKSANQTVYNATAASSATAYDIGINPGVEANAMVFLDGVMQHHDTFSFSGSTLTFDAAPVNGTKIEVIVDNLINLQSSNLTVDTFTATSNQTAFTLSDSPAAESNLIVFINGVFQNQAAYTISNNTLTLDTGVVSGRTVTVYVINPVNIGTPSDGTVTSAKLSGNITTPGTLTVGSHDVAFDSPTFVVDNSNSRVGLGTASPSVPVDIVGDVKMSANLTVDTSTLVVDSSNNRVGIGSTSPSSKLDVAGTLACDNTFSISDGTTSGFLQCSGGNLQFGGSTNHPLIFYSNNAERMRIDSAGSVSIGTTTSTAPFNVQADGAARGIRILGRDNGTSDEAALTFADNANNTTVDIITIGNALTFFQGGSETLRLDANGKLLVGGTASGGNGIVQADVGFDAMDGSFTTSIAIRNYSSASNSGQIMVDPDGNGADSVLYVNVDGVTPSKLKLDSAGRLNIDQVDTRFGTGALNITGEVGASFAAIQFRHNASTVVGSVVTAASSTTYNTSSDYRLKENVDYNWDATTRLKQLKPARFNWISDETNTLVDGFLAHEVSDIVPAAITGEKDAMMDEKYEITPAVLGTDGSIVTEAVMGTHSVPDYQTIDHSKLVPLLVKTIQELEARITALES